MSGRLMSSQVDPSRSRSIQVVWFSFFGVCVVGFAGVCSLSLLGYGQFTGLQGFSLASRFPVQRESWLHDNEDTLSAMPIHISAQGFCVTVFHAIALCQWCDGPRKGKAHLDSEARIAQAGHLQGVPLPIHAESELSQFDAIALACGRVM